MNTPSTPGRRASGPNNTAICARLATIEERLDAIIKRLDEMKNLSKILTEGQSKHHHAGKG